MLKFGRFNVFLTYLGVKGTPSSRSILTEENCPVPFTRKFFPVFPYKRKALQVSQIWDKHANTHASMQEVFDRSQSICWARTTMLLKKKMKTQITSGTKWVQKIIGFVGRSSKLFRICSNYVFLRIKGAQGRGEGKPFALLYDQLLSHQFLRSLPVTTPATHARYVIKS